MNWRCWSACLNSDLPVYGSGWEGHWSSAGWGKMSTKQNGRMFIVKQGWFDKDFFLLSWRVQPNLFLLCVMVLKSKENRGLSESDVSWIQTFWFWSEFTSLFTIMERVRVRVLTIVHCVDWINLLISKYEMGVGGHGLFPHSFLHQVIHKPKYLSATINKGRHQLGKVPLI